MSEDKTISINQIAKDVAKINNNFILYEHKTYRIIFKPTIHKLNGGGVRGVLVIAKKEKPEDKNWVEQTKQKINQLEYGELLGVELKTDTINKFVEAIEHSKNILHNNGAQSTDNRYQLVDKDKIILTSDNIVDVSFDTEKFTKKDVIKFLGKFNNNNKFSNLIINTLDQEKKERIINELTKRLKNITKYKECSGEENWQDWIYKNIWLFGGNYINPISKEKINIKGSMPDFLFLTIDGFVDVVEIKLPDDVVIKQDKSRQNSWYFSPEVNRAIGQMTNYLNEIDRTKLEIEKNIEREYGITANITKPRAFILIGDNDDWEVIKKEALRKLNFTLHNIEILTYRDLLNRGKQFFLKNQHENKK